MDLYTFSLLLGGAGLAAMGINSLGHHGHSQAHSHQAHHGSSHGHHGHHGHHHTGHGHEALSAVSRTALSLLSPRVLFSVLLGLGLTGMLARNLIGGAPLFIAALAGGIAFERIVVAPLWNFLLRFASRPAVTLESCVTDDATAVTAFDKKGQGLIAVEVDGQMVQVLGTLQAADREAGVRVKAGDRVRIEEVDAARNRCTVSVP